MILDGEGVEVAGIPACHDAVRDDDRAVDPGGAGVLHVGPDGMVGGHVAPFGHPRLDQEPRCVTDGGDDAAVVHEVADERDGPVVHAQEVRVDLAAGKDERVVVRSLNILQRLVGVDSRGPSRSCPSP
jgi:hypothetical protein